jgi:hypothetical protein
MNIVKKNGRLAIVEVGGRYHVVEITPMVRRMGSPQVMSVMPSDRPRGGGDWYADATEAGVRYVSKGRTLSGAISGFYREFRRG